MPSMNYFDSDMSNNTNTVVPFYEKSGNLCLLLRAMSHTIYITHVGCSIIHDNSSACALRRESLIDGTTVKITLCLHVLALHIANNYVCHQHDLVNRDGIFVSQMTTGMFRLQ